MITLDCVHGFLGSASDWAEIASGLPGPVVSSDLFARGGARLAPTLANWGAAFAAGKSGRRALIGYSLGGRLALHALASHPEVWSCAVIVSSHLGLADPGDRLQRLERDRVWAKRFAEEPWSRVVDAWNAQAVFAGRPNRPRYERDFDRAALAHALSDWSLGLERPFDCAGLPPILFIRGSDDPTAHACDVLLDGAAHRVPWEATAAFCAVATQFIHTHGSSATR